MKPAGDADSPNLRGVRISTFGNRLYSVGYALAFVDHARLP